MWSESGWNGRGKMPEPHGQHCGEHPRCSPTPGSSDEIFAWLQQLFDERDQGLQKWVFCREYSPRDHRLYRDLEEERCESESACRWFKSANPGYTARTSFKTDLVVRVFQVEPKHQQVLPQT